MSFSSVIRNTLLGLLPRPKTPAAIAEQSFRRAASKLGVSDIAIDCGANVGRYTKVLADTRAQVYAFEPNPDAFAVLRQRMQGYPNVICVNKAVAAEAGSLRLFLHEQAADDPVRWSTGSSVLSVKANVNPETYVDVESVDFVEFVLSLGSPIKLVKMDIEGAEVALLQRLVNHPLAMNAIGQLFVETHDHKIPELRDDTEQLRKTIRQAGLDRINLDWK